jgi:hypothetical protein
VRIEPIDAKKDVTNVPGCVPVSKNTSQLAIIPNRQRLCRMLIVFMSLNPNSKA